MGVNIQDASGVDQLITVHESVFARQQDLHRSPRHLQVAPREIDMFVVTANGDPISSSRTESLPAPEFAALWGGGTEARWRGNGLSRAQISRRAQLAAERGQRYLVVLPPILTGLGSETILHVSRYVWTAGDE